MLLLTFLMLTACQSQIDSPLESSIASSTINTPELTQDIDPTPENKTNMDLLKGALIDFCSSNLTATDNYQVTTYTSNKDFPQTVANIYGIDPTFLIDGFIINDSDNTPFELVVLHMTSNDAANYGFQSLSSYKKEIKEHYIERDTDGIAHIPKDNEISYDLASNAQIIQHNEFLALFICENSEGVTECFKTTLQSIQTDSEKEIAIEIADGVFFIESPWIESKDAPPDPNHPGRSLYVQPNKEDMSIYDTTAIINAWSTMDTHSLSAYDKSIYDSAKNVLDHIIYDEMSDFQKEVVIYEWILQNIEYDWSHTDPLAETSRDSYTPYGGLVNHSAICLGYATSFQLLSELSGIETITVVGTGRGSDHSWNMIRLNDEWYCVDITWDMPYYDSEKDVREWRFFNTTSNYMAKTGHQWDYNNIPEATAEDHGYIKQK